MGNTKSSHKNSKHNECLPPAYATTNDPFELSFKRYVVYGTEWCIGVEPLETWASGFSHLVEAKTGKKVKKSALLPLCNLYFEQISTHGKVFNYDIPPSFISFAK